jgi:Rab-like protein 3
LLPQIHQAGGKEYFIEFWDIGGNDKFAQARSVFYKDAQGLILVHDLSNKKSHANLKPWLHQVVRDIGGSDEYVWSDELLVSTVSASSNLSLPVLVVGTKLDLVSDYRHMGMSDENGLDTLNIVRS